MKSKFYKIFTFKSAGREALTYNNTKYAVFINTKIIFQDDVCCSLGTIRNDNNHQTTAVLPQSGMTMTINQFPPKLKLMELLWLGPGGCNQNQFIATWKKEIWKINKNVLQKLWSWFHGKIIDKHISIKFNKTYF